MQRVVAVLEHCAKDGSSKILKECSLPITGRGVVDRIITELAVFDVRDGKLVLRELQPGASLEDVRTKTDAEFEVDLA